MREVYIEFIVYGDNLIDHKELTQIIGVYPTKTRKKGEEIRSNLRAVDNSWIYQTSKLDTFYVEDLIENIYELINPIMHRLMNYLEKKSLRCKFNIVISTPFDESFPSLYFSEDFIKLCSLLNAPIDTDIYID